MHACHAEHCAYIIRDHQTESQLHVSVSEGRIPGKLHSISGLPSTVDAWSAVDFFPTEMVPHDAMHSGPEGGLGIEQYRFNWWLHTVHNVSVDRLNR
jgi:hypothetical protein